MSRALFRVFVFAPAVVGIPLFLAASWWSYRIAHADLLESRPTIDHAREAVSLTPASAAAHENAAALYVANDPLSGKDAPELEAAVKLSPRDSAAWMALGLSAEMRGDMNRAEECLLEAARIDHMFKPAWSLANFYLRSGQEDKFWPWIRRCTSLLQTRHGEPRSFDPNAVFALCWNMTTDAETIERLAIPAQPLVLGQYITFLVATERIDAAVSAAARLYPLAGMQDLQFLFLLCDSLIERERGADAVTVWNGAISGRLPLYERLDAAAGESLTNGGLASEPRGAGFDWRIASPADVYGRYSEATRSLKFDVNGDEPENCELLSAAVPLAAGRHYRFGFRYRTSEMTGNPGLHWSLLDAAHSERASEIAFGARDEDGESTFEFATPQDVTMGWLALRYDRKTGTTRPRGSLMLGAMHLELLP